MKTPKTSALRGLYVITDAHLGGGHEQMARAALRGGAKILQLRDKNTPAAEILTIARRLRLLTREHDAIFLINDHVELALECEADGVHLGDDDFPLAKARRVLGQGAIIGVSASTPESARAAKANGASYLGVGAVFGTQTKLDAGAPLGLENLRAVIGATSLPVAAIGGVNQSNIASVLAMGAPMACVISALCAGIDPDSPEIEAMVTQNVRELAALVEQGQAR